MNFLTNSHVEGSPSASFSGGQTGAQALLISLGLAYLAIPNFLFLWGWFVPWVAVLVSALILVAAGRAGCALFQASAPFAKPSRRGVMSLVAGVLVALLVILFFIASVGQLGFVPVHADIYVQRQGMFSNLRDAAWPVILPNGREMSYYLAGTLPAAAMARLVPAASAWCIAAWTALPALLALLLLSSSAFPKPSHRWGALLAVTAVFMALFVSPLSTVTPVLFPEQVLLKLESLTGMEWTWILPDCNMPVGERPLSPLGNLYNSAPAVLLATAITLCCRRKEEIVLPVTLSLLVPISPFGGLALLPLVAARLFPWLKERGVRDAAQICREMPLPAVMFLVSLIYFTRADGDSVVSLSGIAFGWGRFLYEDAWLVAGAVLLFLPLLFIVRKDTFFLVLLGCYILLPFVFIGTMSEPGKGVNNELWLKAHGCYTVVVAFYWLRYWSRIGWYKYVILVMAFGTLSTLIAKDALLFGSREYLQVDDLWNGHLNHDDPFLDQSVPPCKEPLVRGVMLRKSGESEEHFPGCLLPKAPGCDYSKPANDPMMLKNLIDEVLHRK